MAEEQKWQEPTDHLLCANNCGFFGSPTTLNLCSKCYKDHCLKQRHISTPKITLTRQSETSPPESSSSSTAAVAAVSGEPVFVSPDQPISNVTVPTASGEQRNRCGSCRKRVGLTGFTCKCGVVFCGAHRYPEKHECSFDFKTVGKEAIARANPVVKAAKLDRI